MTILLQVGVYNHYDKMINDDDNHYDGNDDITAPDNYVTTDVQKPT